MSKARDNLMERAFAFSEALKKDAIVTKSFSEKEHNSAARILRNGLAVIGFAMMEDFIKARTSEIMEKIGTGRTSFGELSILLQRAAAVDILSSLKFQASLREMDANATIKLFQDASAQINSTTSAVYDIHPMVFGYDKSNINENTVENILNALWCKEGWQTLKSIGHKCGVGIPDLKAAFKNSALRRHQAAHDASAAVEFSELESFHKEIISICMCFDLLISIGLRKILDRDAYIVVNSNPLASRHVAVRFIDQKMGKFSESIPGGKRVIKNYSTLKDAKDSVLPKAKSSCEAVVVRAEDGTIKSWYTPYLG